MSDYIKTDKVLDLLAGVVAEIIKMPSEEPETDYDGCYNCIHTHDSEDVCRVRGCVHAIGQIKDFYKRATDTHDNARETHSCDNERTETHDLISRKAAIDAVLDRMNVEKHGRDAKPEEIRWTLEALPSAEPKIIHCRDCEYGEIDQDGWWFCTNTGCQVGESDGSGFCADAEKRR